MLSFLNSVFCDTHFDYNPAITGGNVKTIDDATLVFVLVDHDNIKHSEFFAEVIYKFADTDVDIGLVEESKDLLGNSLFQKLREHSPIKAKALSSMQIYGWDHPKRELWLLKHKEEINKVKSAGKILSDKKSAPDKKIFAFVKLVACHNALSFEKIEPKNYLNDLLVNYDTDSMRTLIAKVQGTLPTYITLKNKQFVARTFDERQIAFEESIFERATYAKGKLFIDLGAHHAAPSNNPFKDKVTPFLQRIGLKFKYILLSP